MISILFFVFSFFIYFYIFSNHSSIKRKKLFYFFINYENLNVFRGVQVINYSIFFVLVPNIAILRLTFNRKLLREKDTQKKVQSLDKNTMMMRMMMRSGETNMYANERRRSSLLYVYTQKKNNKKTYYNIYNMYIYPLTLIRARKYVCMCD